MTIYLINGKPHLANGNGFKAITEADVWDMAERNEIHHIEVIEND